VNDAAIIIDTNKQILSWNRAAEAIYGWVAAEVLGKCVDDVIPVIRFLNGSTIHDVRVAYEHEGYWNGEVIQRHRDGHELVIDGTSQVIRDDHGAITTIIAVNRDVTARKQAEEALRESEERFRELAESIHQVFWIADAKTMQSIYISPAFESIWGCAREGAIRNAQSVLDAIHPDDRERERRIAAGAWQRQGTYEAEYRIVRPSGEIRWIWTRAFPVRSAQGEVYRIAGIAEDITERKHAEQALRDSEERFRHLFEYSPDAIFLIDPDHPSGMWPIVDCNEAAARMNGYPREEIIGQSITIFNPNPEAPNQHPENYVKLWREGVVQDEDIHYRKDGTLVHIEYMTSLVTIGGRRLVLGIDRDITERKQAEQDYRNLFELANDAILVFEPEGEIILDVNNRACSLYGFPREQFVGKSLKDLSQDPGRGERYLQILRAEGTYQGFETIQFRADGTLLHLLINASMIQYQGRPAVLSINRDITERKQAERIVRESEERLRRLAEASFEGIIIHDRGKILDTNESFAAMLGYERAAVIGKNVLELAAPEARAGLASRIRSGDDRPFESIGLRKDGTTFPVEIQSRPTPYQGRMVRVAAIRDLTERKQAEQERIAIERKLLETQKLESLGVLAGGVAHDFNNLLAVILGNASLALLKLPPDSDVRGAIEAIKTAAQHGADLPRQMLAYAGKGPAATQQIDLNMLVAEISDLLKASIGKNITLEYQLAPNLPMVDADPGQMRQVVLNLIINASEAIGEQEGRITLAIDTVHAGRGTFAKAYFGETLAPGEYVRLKVRDTGSGMDAATKARIFEPFFTTKFIGRGLGLAVLLGIVRSHRGALKVNSKPGQGTTFTILLPAAAAPATLPDVEEEPRIERGSGTVLVIDDEDGVRSIAADLLQRCGFTTLVAADGDAGVATFSSHADEIAGVLLDITMPGMSSEEIVSEIRRHRPHVPIVLMSGYPEQQVAERFAGDELAGFLPKPFTATQIQETVTTAIRRARRQAVRHRS
ncbi:MAG TPA: PAS domain S-box protein, partial [Herpetosiphonaceae bacterium]|nr:PAS domain S-box protein [Herpetosiphonaceae bacterium]